MVEVMLDLGHDPACEIWQDAFDARLDFLFADLDRVLPSALPSRT